MKKINYSPSYWIDLFLQKIFYYIGYLSAKLSIIFIIFSILLTVGGFLSIYYLIEFENDPIKLWSPPKSRTLLEKEYFDDNFGAFYRVQQLILTPKTDNAEILRKDYFLELYEIQKEIGNINLPNNTNLNSLCFKPIPNKGCIIDSPIEYFQSDLNLINKTDPYIYEHIGKCL
jgi:Niemann-Pick C1 protein